MTVLQIKLLKRSVLSLLMLNRDYLIFHVDVCLLTIIRYQEYFYIKILNMKLLLDPFNFD